MKNEKETMQDMHGDYQKQAQEAKKPGTGADLDAIRSMIEETRRSINRSIDSIDNMNRNIQKNQEMQKKETASSHPDNNTIPYTIHAEKQPEEKPAFRKPPEQPAPEQQGMKSNRTRVSFIESSADAIPAQHTVSGVEKPGKSGQSDISGKPKKQKSAGNTGKSGKSGKSGNVEEIQDRLDTVSRIRRMQNSTRAKEAEKNKKNLKKGKPVNPDEENYTYQKERPDGEYLYSQAAQELEKKNKNRKRRRFGRQNDVTAVAMETLHLDLRDIVPVAVPPPQEPVRPVDVKPAPRAQHTSVNLSTANRKQATADTLDVTIRRTAEEAEEENLRRQKISAMMRLENTADIQTDIRDLRNSIFFRMMALMLVAIVSAYLSVRQFFTLEILNIIPENLASLMQLLLGLAAASVCVPVVKNGITRLLHKRADTDSLATVALFSCMMDEFFGIFGVSTPLLAHHFMPVAVLILLLHTAGKLLIVDREEANLKVASSRFDCYGLQVVEDETSAEAFARGVVNDFPVLTTLKKTDSLKDFRRYTYSADMADWFCHYAAPVTVIFSAIVSIIMAILRHGGISYAVTLFSMFCVACGCAGITLVVNLPLFKATRKLTKSNTLMLGYQSVDDFYDTNSVMLDAASMFPDSAVKLKGAKMYSNIRTDETVLTAASLARHAGSAFSHIFDEMLKGRPQMLYPVENYVYEDSLGLCGWIHNQRVLLGNRDLMISHHIEGVPSKNKEAELVKEDQEVIYLSVSGNLSAWFVVQLQADKVVKSWVKQAMRHNISLVLYSIDPMITLHRISSLFAIPQDMVKIIPAKMQDAYAVQTAPVKELSTSMACTNHFSNIMQLLVASKIVRRAAMVGVFVQAVTILVGLALVLMESVLRLGITPGWMILLQCATAVLTLLCVNIRRLY